jgi:glycosidase
MAVNDDQFQGPHRADGTLGAQINQRIPGGSFARRTVAIDAPAVILTVMRAENMLLEHLTALYGVTTAQRVLPRLNALLDAWSGKLPALSPTRALGELPLTERDALLITYADQVREPGVAPLQTLGAFATRHLPGLVSGIHLLPFYPWSSDDGFSVKDYYAVDPAFGTWDDIQKLSQNFDLMFDAVINHLSAQSEWFKKFLAGDPAFQDFFVSVDDAPDLSRVIRPRALPLLTEFPSFAGPRRIWTTFSADQVDLNLRNPEVLLALLDVLLFYMGQGARLIRLDAIAFLWKEAGTTCLHLPQTHRVIQLMRAMVDAVAPRTLLITETNVPHVDNVSYFGNGTNEAHLVYNFALPPLVMHSFAAGNALKLTAWARALAVPSRQVTYFNFLASHDGIGINPVRGILTEAEIDGLVARTIEHGGLISYKHLPDGSKAPYEMNISYFDALSNPASTEPDDTQIRRSLCAHAIQFALAGLPGIYFHSLFGSRGDRAGADTSGIPRRINRQKIDRSTLEKSLADPASRPARVFAGMRSLLHVRGASPAFHPSAPQETIAADPRLFVLRRHSADWREEMLCVQNVSGETVNTVLPAPLRKDGTWRAVIGTSPGIIARESTTVAPYEVIWARRDGG